MVPSLVEAQGGATDRQALVHPVKVPLGDPVSRPTLLTAERSPDALFSMSLTFFCLVSNLASVAQSVERLYCDSVEPGSSPGNFCLYSP